ncbi:MAG: NADH-quinone oxidoreductase subunit NuoF [Methylococcales bacterium]
MTNAQPSLPLTQYCTSEQPLTLSAYQQQGGYSGFKTALEQTPERVLETIKDSRLRGRGGAGFPTGLKWSFVPQGDNAPSPKYLVANGDEMEPGAFKDRYLLEQAPHQLIEGMLIAAHTIGASIGYIFLRYEYHMAAKRIENALQECYQAGLLGNKIQGSELTFDLHIHTSAGRYICGEETALINALEGKRANPRAKPPYPQVAGLWGKPTIVNNIETFFCLPGIVQYGADWFQQLGRHKDSGTKLFGVSGRVKKPGLWELPMGTTIREIIEEHAGGMCDGYQLRGLIPGGGSTDFLLPEHLDTPMDYDEIGNVGSRMGTGTITVLDDQFCPVDMVHNLVAFFAQESCGWCTPCRDGLPSATYVLEQIETGHGKPEDMTFLEDIVDFVAPGNTFCALAPGAAEPLQSALKYFRDDFDQHIKDGCCPYQAVQ